MANDVIGKFSVTVISHLQRGYVEALYALLRGWFLIQEVFLDYVE